MFKKADILKFMNFWPPYFGAGVKVRRIAPDYRSIDVEMKLRFWNKNYVGTHFGGSMYSMTDPFIMLMLIQNLGRDYIVWDKAATIRFKKPGRGVIKAHFEISEEEIARVKALADSQPKVEPTYLVEIRDETGDVVAEVEKLLYIRRKDNSRARAAKPSITE